MYEMNITTSMVDYGPLLMWKANIKVPRKKLK
jgi:hypothetical protein